MNFFIVVSALFGFYIYMKSKMRRYRSPQLGKVVPGGLKSLRSWLGYSVREMAAAIRVPKSTYLCYEKGQREPRDGAVLIDALLIASVSGRKSEFREKFAGLVKTADGLQPSSLILNLRPWRQLIRDVAHLEGIREARRTSSDHTIGQTPLETGRTKRRREYSRSKREVRATRRSQDIYDSNLCPAFGSEGVFTPRYIIEEIVNSCMRAVSDAVRNDFNRSLDPTMGTGHFVIGAQQASGEATKTINAAATSSDRLPLCPGLQLAEGRETSCEDIIGVRGDSRKE